MSLQKSPEQKLKEFCKQVQLEWVTLKAESKEAAQGLAGFTKDTAIWKVKNPIVSLLADVQELKKKFDKFSMDTVRESVVDDNGTKIFLSFRRKMEIEGAIYTVGDKLKFVRYSQHRGYGDKDIEIIGFDAMANDRVVLKGSKGWVESIGADWLATYFKLKK